eukprot:CAMPEP_0195037326 /NCGR_PEP_ID=MMETSP0326_2-20130528/74707_1 /TAXON_ID=2866 ORGANISM="Crypthecodinium cohnii, Strain Seligo" /NCGR_SAMPLE_ID=MMETSP0326_2 /ASSEMBLY_ACC=CAM_ASM_000348 /LENGTH=35 /DNA_ID= /DNA_START= /DNA_END= /DNA_ORIENTATION=
MPPTSDLKASRVVRDSPPEQTQKARSANTSATAPA